jgi:hypothetical protein
MTDADAAPHADAENDAPLCSICHETLEGSASSKLLCGHAFHSSCIVTALQYPPHKCPVCRSHPDPRPAAADAAEASAAPIPMQTGLDLMGSLFGLTRPTVSNPMERVFHWSYRPTRQQIQRVARTNADLRGVLRAQRRAAKEVRAAKKVRGAFMRQHKATLREYRKHDQMVGRWMGRCAQHRKTSELLTNQLLRAEALRASSASGNFSPSDRSGSGSASSSSSSSDGQSRAVDVRSG